eukprot:m.180914 g.180914  ORF g.180914 m.180914 type:complete len:239 (-) comp32040_c3_seq1:135-851(-)
MSRNGDRWISSYEQATAKADEITAAINERDRLARTGQNASKVTSQVRRLVAEVSQSIVRLEDSLNTAGREYHITDAEFNRRQNLVSTLKGRKDQLASSFQREGGNMSGGGDRNQLFGDQESGGGRRPAREEDESTRGRDSHGLLERQQMVMRDQDDGLDILAASIARQKNMGLAIGNELDDQDEMLDELGDAMDRTDQRLTRTTGQVMQVTEKAKSGGMCCCIVLLILAIIGVAVAPI